MELCGSLWINVFCVIWIKSKRRIVRSNDRSIPTVLKNLHILFTGTEPIYMPTNSVRWFLSPPYHLQHLTFDSLAFDSQTRFHIVFFLGGVFG